MRKLIPDIILDKFLHDVDIKGQTIFEDMVSYFFATATTGEQSDHREVYKDVEIKPIVHASQS